MITRRQFLKYSAIAGAAAALPLKFGVRSALAYNVSPGLQKLVQAMPLFGAQIPLAQPAPSQPYTGVDYYLREVAPRIFTESPLILVGTVFVLMVIFVPQGLLGFLRRPLNR